MYTENTLSKMRKGSKAIKRLLQLSLTHKAWSYFLLDVAMNNGFQSPWLASDFMNCAVIIVG